MDTQALTNLHAALRAQDFMGDMGSLASLLSKAKDETQERLAMSYWKSVGTPAQATLVANAFTHARKHSMKVIYSTGSPEHLILANRRSDPAIRLTTIDLVGKGVRLVFFKNGECIGERSIYWKRGNTNSQNVHVDAGLKDS